jgi:REP element-mobilizing transposase RayT
MSDTTGPANSAGESAAPETPFSPVAANDEGHDPQELADARAGGLLGSPRLESPVTPVSPAGDMEAIRTFFQTAKSAETETQEKRAKLTASVFSVMQYETHADTGAVMVTQAQLESGLSMASIKKYALAWHDLDRFDDEEAQQQKEKGRDVTSGDLKPRHVHIVIACDHDYSIRQISDWLMIPSARIRIPREQAEKDGRKAYAGRGAREKAFFDMCQYLTHEGSKQRGKHQYDRSVVQANFDFDGALDDHLITRAKTGGGSVTAADKLAMQVLGGELTVAQAMESDPLSFSRFAQRIRRMRAEFLAHQPPAPHRINLYLEGPGGIGKDLLAKALARTLVPGDWEPGVRDPFFAVGGDNVTWEGYDGQQVVIIEEARAGTLIKKFGRTELFQFLSPFPTRQLFNVKNSSTQLLNTVTILTSPDPYEDFLDGLAGEYVDRFGTPHKAENKAQAYRRIPIIIPVREGSFSLLVNKGFVNGTRDFEEYEHYGPIRQDLQQIARRSQGIADGAQRTRTQLALEARQVAPIIEQHQRVVAATSTDAEDPDALFAELSGLGQPIPEDEVNARVAAEMATLRAKVAAAKARESSSGEVVIHVRNAGGTAIQTISPEMYRVLIESSESVAA